MFEGIVVLASLGLVIVALAIKPLRDWLFAPKEWRDKGFPLTRHKRERGDE